MSTVNISNPFEYEAAVNYAADDLVDLFVEDHNYSRFIQSPRNIFLIGERGCGKSMTLLFNSYFKQERKAQKEGKAINLDTLGIYIPCNNPLFFKREYDLIDNPLKVSVISEHFLVLAIAFEISRVLSYIDNSATIEEAKTFAENLEYVLGIKLKEDQSVFKSLCLYFQKLSTDTQKLVNNNDDKILEDCVTFYSLIIPLIRQIKELDKFKRSHFLFLIDDAHDLNHHQTKTLNSWIAYRDHTDFSFKVAIAKVREHSYITANGSSILEEHDFLRIDMEKPYQSKLSDYGQWAKDIVLKRLAAFNISVDKVDDFFPINESVEKEIKACEEEVRREAEKIYSNSPNRTKQITDHVYKYARARYFQNRSPRANRPQYTGWETIVHLSTGVIRNLLYPCYWMYDKELSQLPSSNGKHQIPKSIKPGTQNEVIQEKSQELWNKIDNDLFNSIDNCSTKQAEYIKNLFDNLMGLFRQRLLDKSVSEPRAITFTISGKKDFSSQKLAELQELLRISKEAQILYDRISSAKDDGLREVYYVPNRLLFPIRGLDVVGQHARVSIKASELYAAAFENKKINEQTVTQKSLFDYED